MAKQELLTQRQIDDIIQALPQTRGDNYYQVMKRTLAANIEALNAARSLFAEWDTFDADYTNHMDMQHEDEIDRLNNRLAALRKVLISGGQEG